MKAFPHKGGGVITDINGMDLRDYFAAKAMQALLVADPDKRPNGLSLSVSTAAYQMADVMMEARAK